MTCLSAPALAGSEAIRGLSSLLNFDSGWAE
jgi:hypothetical protein